MSSLLCAGKRFAILGWLLAIPFAVDGQAIFSRQGGEYAIAGALPGDQTFPQAAVDYTGGYLVWQDNSINTNGLSIASQRLDVNLVKSGPIFRVNFQNVGDQEQPQVALLKGGGAVFVWQGGRHGFQRVFIRFLTAGGLFVTADAPVSAYSGGYQIYPSVATLGDGSVVVVWSSFGEDGSLQGVFGQRFSAMGAKLGGEFQVNQWTPNNQRSPSVAALTNGRFVVAWISELERDTASVDVYARVFDSSAIPLTDEFPLNTSTSNSCANPVVAGSASGGFAAAWSQNDNVVLGVESGAGGFPSTTKSTNSWDILGRQFDANGAATTDPTCLNTTRYGDQYVPRLAAFGTNYLVDWTSLGQDGDREGVYGQFWNGDGSFSGGEFRVNTTTISRQMQPTLASDNHSRILAVWTSWGPGINAFDLFAQCYVTTNTIPVQTNNVAPPVLDPTNVFAIRMQSSAYPNPPVPGNLNSAFLAAAGSYNGLFYEAAGPRVASSGYFTATTTGGGTCSGKLQLGGRTYSISGAFDSTGWVTFTITRSGMSPLTVSLQLDLAGGNRIRGCVTDGTWLADLLADRQVFNKSSNPTPLAGQYTLSIPGNGAAANLPAGDGIGTITMDAGGNLQWSGTLADGTKFSQKSAISGQGYWPLFASLYSGGGSVIGWLQFSNQPASDLAGPVVWINPGGPNVKYYPAGFTNEIWSTGSLYTPPVAGAPALNSVNSALISFSGGNLGQSVTNQIGFASNGKVTNLSSNKLSLTITTSSGLFSGSVPDPVSGKTLTFKGALFEKANLGSGFFLRSDQSGRVYLSPTP